MRTDLIGMYWEKAVGFDNPTQTLCIWQIPHQSGDKNLRVHCRNERVGRWAASYVNGPPCISAAMLLRDGIGRLALGGVDRARRHICQKRPFSMYLDSREGNI